MSIDWFTFAAQIVNFLILIWLLKRFLYGPVVRAMAEREDRIAKQFEDAEAAQRRADNSELDYKHRLQELAQASEEMTAKASQDADAWRTEQLRRAKADVEESRREWQQLLRREQQALVRDLQLDVAQHAVELGRHVLRELADQTLQTRLVERFLSRLSATDLRALHASSGNPADAGLVVESSHELSEEHRAQITAALSDVSSEVTFRCNSNLICGVELQCPGYRFTWNLREAVAEVESDLIDAIEATLPGVSTDHAEIESITPSEMTSL